MYRFWFVLFLIFPPFFILGQLIPQIKTTSLSSAPTYMARLTHTPTNTLRVSSTATPTLAAPQPTPGPKTISLELINQVGGEINDITVQEPYAYIGIGARVVVLDISDPAAPRFVAQTPVLQSGVDFLTIVDNRLYLFAGGLRIFDISNPTKPVQIGSYELESVTNLAVRDKFVYAPMMDWVFGDSTPVWELKILDTSNPLAIREFNLQGEEAFGQVVVAEDKLYAVNGKQLTVFDLLADQTIPTPIGSYELEETAISLSDNNIAYVHSHDSDVHLIDLTNPNKPTEVGTIKVEGRIFSLTSRANILYISEAGKWQEDKWIGDGLSLWNISNPGKPARIGYYNALPENWTYPRNMMVSGSSDNIHAYIAFENGLSIINVSNPEKPYQTGFYPSTGEITDGIVVANTAYAVCQQIKFCLFDLTQPITPSLVETYKLPHPVTSIEQVGTRAYILYNERDQASQLSIIDISYLPVLQELGVYTTQHTIDGLKVISDTVYLAVRDEGLHIVNTSDPARPRQVGLYSAPDNYMVPFTVADDTAYLSQYDSLLIVDVSNPRNPTELGRYKAEQSFTGMEIVNKTLYTGLWRMSLLRINVSDPRHPIGQPDGIDSTHLYSGVGTFIDNMAYLYGYDSSVQGGGNGFHVFDVSDPEHPRKMGRIELSKFDVLGWEGPVVVKDNLIYVFSSHNGLLVISTQATTN